MGSDRVYVGELCGDSGDRLRRHVFGAPEGRGEWSHLQVEVTVPLALGGGRMFLDAGIAPLVEQLWESGSGVLGACADIDGAGNAVVVFARCSDALQFMRHIPLEMVVCLELLDELRAVDRSRPFDTAAALQFAARAIAPSTRGVRRAAKCAARTTSPTGRARCPKAP